jgi:hypothetical protein
MAKNAMVIPAHPPYSPDLTSSDCYIFGDITGLFRGESFKTGERLLSAADGILRSLEKSTLTRIFFGWMRRPERCIETNGDHVRQPKINSLVVIGFKR